MTTFYAQPYDISATGFYFDTEDQYQAKIRTIKNDYGQTVEEFEIQFIDGETIDAQLTEAIGINQANICQAMELIDEWSDDQKVRAIIAVGECGYSFNSKRFDPDHIDIDLYEIDSLRDLAMQFVDDGLFGEIPERISMYLDYEMIARELACDYSMISIDGTNYAYRCG
jgi:antirestriction protein